MRGNLNAANVPLLSNLFGRSIIIPQYDQNFQRTQFSGEDPQLDKGIPQIWYAHNCMPTGQGMQSVSYKRIVANVPGQSSFVRTYIVRDSSENKALLGITSTGKVYILSSFTSGWVDITPGGGWTGGATSIAVVNGVTYLCLSLFNIYTVNIASSSLAVAALLGVTPANIVGIGTAANYLLLHDNTTVYWSSTVNPLDFVPSLVTGASSGNPTDISGIIIGINTYGGGFIVMTTAVIVTAKYSGNTRYPWIFVGVPNSAGVADIEYSTVDGDDGSNYVWTSGGVLKITSAGAVPVFPEVTDFLAGRLFEDFDTGSNTFIRTPVSVGFKLKLCFVGSRYLIISYGISSLTHAVVYDTAFKRWGKLKTPHVDCFELSVNAAANRSWISLLGSGWNAFIGTAWRDMLTFSNLPADAKRTIAFLAADGSCTYTLFDAGDITADAVCLVGKYQLVRTETVRLEEVAVENIESGNTGNFSLTVMSAADGKNLTPSTPYLQMNTTDFRKYLANITALNHSLLFKGAFALTSLTMTFSRQGRR